MQNPQESDREWTENVLRNFFPANDRDEKQAMDGEKPEDHKPDAAGAAAV